MAFVDVTGQPLDFELLFPDRGATTATDHPLSDFLFLLLTNFPGETAQQQKDILAATIGDVLLLVGDCEENRKVWCVYYHITQNQRLPVTNTVLKNEDLTVC